MNATDTDFRAFVEALATASNAQLLTIIAQETDQLRSLLAEAEAGRRGIQVAHVGAAT